MKKQDLWKEAHDLHERHGSYTVASRVSGIPRSVLHQRRSKWIEHVTGSKPKDARKIQRGPSKEAIEEICVAFYRDKMRRPTYAELLAKGINRDIIRARYGNISALFETVEINHTDEISKHVATGRVLFSRDKFEHVSEVVGDHNRFLVTTAVAGKEIDDGFLDAIRSYNEKNSSVLLILPTADPDGSMTDEHLLVYDEKLNYENVIVDPVAFNDCLSISGIKLRAKQINPLTGLARLGQRNNSTIFASPKQQLTYTATSNEQKMPHAGICTGAITRPDYSQARFAGARTAALAINDHVMGAIVVEVVDERYFHFRQVQAIDGEFIDLCVRYRPDGTTAEEPATLILGDWHAGATDQAVRESVGEMLRVLPIKKVVLHDFFDGYAISHHDIDKPTVMARKYELGLASLKSEFQLGAEDLRWFLSSFDGTIVVVKSNHCEFLEKYLDLGKYRNDHLNAVVAHELFTKRVEHIDPVKYGYETYGGITSDRILWLRRDESHKEAEVELGAHGDLGANGSRASLNSLENAYGNCVVGHAHAAAIHRGVYRVGTSSRFDLGYNRGPSSWTHTCCLLYSNGSRQLINFLSGSPDVRGRWRL